MVGTVRVGIGSTTSVVVEQSEQQVHYIRHGRKTRPQRNPRTERAAVPFRPLHCSKDLQLEVLNRVATYVMENEDASTLKVVHCFRDVSDAQKQDMQNLIMLDRIFPRLKIDLVRRRLSPVPNRDCAACESISDDRGGRRTRAPRPPARGS